MNIRLFLLFVVIMGSIGYAVYEPEAEPPLMEEKDADTGLTRHETEELMRTIGYVQ